MKTTGTPWRAVALIALSVLTGCAGNSQPDSAAETTLQMRKAALGEKLFFDPNLSTPPGQACASCHSPSSGFAAPDRSKPISAGAHPERFGNRNAPTAAYAAFSPAFHYDEDEELYVGGLFMDGRASSLEEQAKGPFLSPVEMANRDVQAVVEKVRASDYAALFEEVFGPASLENAERAYDLIAEAIAAFERTEVFSPFTSKYDDYLAGRAELTAQELRGLELFEDPEKGNCAACHPSQPAEDGTPPLFTDFTYDNLGVPRNSSNPYYQQPEVFNAHGQAYVDRGLGTATGDPAQDGKFKVPTLRNIALTGPYMHNGVFDTLREVMDFYNTRDTGDWPPPEVRDNVNREELGDLGLSEQESEDVIAFLRTLTDGYEPERSGVAPDGH